MDAMRLYADDSFWNTQVAAHGSASATGYSAARWLMHRRIRPPVKACMSFASRTSEAGTESYISHANPRTALLREEECEDTPVRCAAGSNPIEDGAAAVAGTEEEG
jgi:hypothetical protein